MEKNKDFSFILGCAATLLLLLSTVPTSSLAALTPSGATPSTAASPTVSLAQFSGSVAAGNQKSIADKMTYMILVAYGASDVSALQGKVNEIDQALKNLNQAAQEIQSAPEEQRLSRANSFIKLAKEQANGICTALSKKAVTCCSRPDACSSGIGAIAEQAAPWVGLIGPILAQVSGQGGAAGCLASMPNIAQGFSQASGASEACTILSDSGQLEDSAGNSVDVYGVSRVCGLLKQIVENATMPPGAETAQKNLVKAIDKQQAAVVAQLHGDAKKAQLQAQSMNQALGGAMSCASGLMSGDDVASVAQDGVDCGNPSDAASNPTLCKGFGSGVFGQGGALSKTSGLDLTPTDIASIQEEPDDSVISPEGVSQETSGNNSNFSNPLASSANSGALGGAGSGPQQKADPRRRRGSPQAKKLVSGYKSSKSGGSGSYGGSRKSSFKGFSSPIQKKKKNDALKKARMLAALSDLGAKGVNPSLADSIFEKSNDRLNSAAIKYNILDFQKSKAVWMEK